MIQGYSLYPNKPKELKYKRFKFKHLWFVWLPLTTIQITYLRFRQKLRAPPVKYMLCFRRPTSACLWFRKLFERAKFKLSPHQISEVTNYEFGNRALQSKRGNGGIHLDYAEEKICMEKHRVRVRVNRLHCFVTRSGKWGLIVNTWTNNTLNFEVLFRTKSRLIYIKIITLEI